MFKIGDFVKINNTNLVGKISRIKTNKNNNLYTVNIVSTNSNIIVDDKNISIINSKNNVISNIKNNVNISYNFDNSNFTNEIMIRHQTVEEALSNLEIFISKAICNNEKRIRIIHGRHGGILRKAVHKYLDTCPYILNYKLGEYYEGSYGVTIAYLK